MTDANETPRDSWEEREPPAPDPVRLAQAVEQVLNAHSAVLMMKKIIWWACAGAQAAGIIGSITLLFLTQSLPMKFLCVVTALIFHEGMVVVVFWVLLTSLRMDMLKELKSMELQLAEFRRRV